MFVLGAAHTIESMILPKCVVIIMAQANNSMGREGETVTFLSRCPLNFSGLAGGFALRNLKRSMLSDC
jgi:hypothetical protein